MCRYWWSRPEKRASRTGCSARPARRIGLTTSLTRPDARVPIAIVGINYGVIFLSYFSLQLDILGARNNIQNVLDVGLRLVELRCA
jgi:hypothetical protein